MKTTLFYFLSPNNKQLQVILLDISVISAHSIKPSSIVPLFSFFISNFVSDVALHGAALFFSVA